MKRLLLLVSMVAFLATSCEKTEIKNEVLTPIGFSTNVGKQTKAIVSTNYAEDQPFGVYAYGYDNGTANSDPVMNNVEILKDTDWKAKETTYYWPNNNTTTINFYAYSPYKSTDVANHQKLNGDISHNETNGLKITGYQHSNQYVDFMVATPVIGATYSDPNGTLANPSEQDDELTPGTVPVKFNHQLTQLIFTVRRAAEYKDIKFTVNKITLNNILNKGDYACGCVKVNTWTSGSWSNHTTEEGGVYEVFPALKYNENSAPNGCPTINENENAKEIDASADINNSTFTTTPITVIPQALTATAQSLTIEYKIEGNNVAEETVTKTIYFNGVNNNTQTAQAITWAPNKKITYNLTIGLKEILFEPSVADWETESSADIDVNNTAGV